MADANAASNPQPDATPDPASASPPTPNALAATPPASGESAGVSPPSPAAAAPAPSDGSASPPTEPAAASAPPKADWRDRRIAELTAKLRAEERRNAAGASSPAAAPAPAPATADFEARVAEAAQAQVVRDKFNERCNEVQAQGRSAFPDFDRQVEQLTRLVDPHDTPRSQAYGQMLSAIFETAKPHELIYKLGQNPNEADRLLGLPPVKMAMEISKLATGAPAAPASATPRPASFVGGSNAPPTELDPTDPDRADKLTTAEWMRRRNAQVAAQIAAKQGRA